MIKIRHYLRFTLLMAMLLVLAPPAIAQDGDEDWDWERVEVDGIVYIIYFTGYRENAIGRYAVCDDVQDWSIKTANIRSSVSCKLEWDQYYDEAAQEWKFKYSHRISAPVTKIWAGFGVCDSLTHVNIPNSVTEIGSGAFSHCNALTHVTLPNSVTEIESGLFACSYNLTNVVIPNSITRIGAWAFEYCEALTHVTIPNSVTYIGLQAFSDCSSLTSVTISNSVDSIDSNAFAFCSSLKNVTIPNTVTYIGSSAFYGCSDLRDIYSQIMNPGSVELDGGVFFGVPKQSCVLHVPPGTEDLYRNADQWKDFIIMGSYEMKTAFSKGFANSFPSSVKPRGVTADGASRMYIYFDEDLSSVKSVTKKIKIDGQEVTDPAIVGNFGEFKKLPNGKYGFDYRAPEDFPEVFSTRNKYEINLEIQVVNNSNKEWVGYKTITVMRPGVLLLHGLLADASTFEAQYRHLLGEGGYEPCQVWNASYRPTNTESFYNNTYVYEVVDSSLFILFNRMAALGIISSKYDLVGHSMGGILTRLYAQNVNADAVNRIITLDTPHHGSQLAKAYRPALYTLLAGSYLPNPFVNKACKLLYSYLSSPRFAAFGDLAPSSNATQDLNSKTCAGIPVHVIGSYMKENTHYEVVSNYAMNGDGLFLNYVFSIPEYQVVEDDHLGFKLMDWFYDGENDGIVPLSSQLGGLNGAYKTELYDTYLGVLGIKSNAHHTKTHHWTETIDAITDLLKLPKTDPCFTTSGFRAPANALLDSGGPSLVSVPEFKEAPETSFINLTLEKNEDEYDYYDEDEYNRDLVATVTTSDDIESFFIFACLGEDKFLVSAWDTEPTVVIPDNYEGNLVFYALGRTANDELVADMDSVEYSSITSLAALDFEDYDDLMMCVGQTLGLNVIATWDNGESEYVKPTYSATPGGILNIDGQMFTPVAVGECELIAEYKGLTCTKKITVYPGSEPVTSRYDVNLDGEVNIADINAVINIILMDASSGMNGDVNDDGEVNIADVNAILNAILSY